MEQLTDKQQLVYDHLQQLQCAQSAYDILNDLRTSGFRAPSQVYRVLNKLLELGLIHKVETLNAFVACEQEHSTGNSVFAICDDCGSVEELPPISFADQVRKCGDRRGFTSREFVIELKGRCSECSRQ